MKKLFYGKKVIMLFIIMAMISLTTTQAQLVNTNPDPNGAPWIAGDAIIDSSLEVLSETITIFPEVLSRDLPYAVNNSNNIYMPPIFDQGSTASCVQCAEIGYVLSYELNRLYNVSSGTGWYGNNNFENLYHPFLLIIFEWW